MEYVEYERLSKVLISIRGCISRNKTRKSFIGFFRRSIDPANIVESSRRISSDRGRYEEVYIDIVSELMYEELEEFTLFCYCSRQGDRMSLHLPSRFYLIRIDEDRECAVLECHHTGIEHLLDEFLP